MKKAYYLDTNVILDDTENIYTLSQDGENIIVICDTVLSELDAKKTGFDDINYNARQFNRLCEKAEIVEKSDINHTAKRVVIKVDNIEMHLVSLIQHDVNEKNTDPKVLQDRKIIETASKIQKEYGELIVLSNDIAFRTIAILQDMNVEAFRNSDKEVDFETFITLELDHDVKLPVDIEKYNIDFGVSGVEFVNTETGNKTYGYRSFNMIEKIDEKLLEKQNCKPINIRQKVLSSMLLADNNDIIVVQGASGSGKNTVVTSAACALRDKKESPYDKIVYIRKAIDSVENKQESLGFLPGSLSDKMSVYIKPLLNTVETLIKRKYKSFKAKNKQELDDKVNEFINDYNIIVESENFLRGSTISNAIIIWDECQNNSQISSKLLATRMGENTKLIVLGDIAQVDNPHTSKYNNAITFLVDKAKKPNDYDVVIRAIELNETVRSKTARFADKW